LHRPGDCQTEIILSKLKSLKSRTSKLEKETLGPKETTPKLGKETLGLKEMTSNLKKTTLKLRRGNSALQEATSNLKKENLALKQRRLGLKEQEGSVIMRVVVGDQIAINDIHLRVLLNVNSWRQYATLAPRRK